MKINETLKKMAAYNPTKQSYQILRKAEKPMS